MTISSSKTEERLLEKLSIATIRLRNPDTIAASKYRDQPSRHTGGVSLLPLLLFFHYCHSSHRRCCFQGPCQTGGRCRDRGRLIVPNFVVVVVGFAAVDVVVIEVHCFVIIIIIFVFAKEISRRRSKEFPSDQKEYPIDGPVGQIPSHTNQRNGQRNDPPTPIFQILLKRSYRL
jgi:hypothetical protein